MSNPTIEQRVEKLERDLVTLATTAGSGAGLGFIQIGELTKRVEDLEAWRRRAIALAAVTGLRLDAGEDLTPGELAALGGVPAPRPLEEEG